MGEFQRSPSKVWWAGENSLVRWRAASASPGSQDSGFSDTETSPALREALRSPVPLELAKTGETSTANLCGNVTEKRTEKSVNLDQLQSTPVRRNANQLAKSEPGGRYTKNKKYTKVSRNLFRSVQLESTIETHQYARDDISEGGGGTSLEETTSNDTSELPDCIKTLPLVKPRGEFLNNTTPAVYYHEEINVFNQSSSDCDSELEALFQESPKHTSTPKTMPKRQEYLKLGRIHAMNLLQKYKHDRVPPITVKTPEDGSALQNWLQEIKHNYQTECTITFQCKSIASDLMEKVTERAGIITYFVRQTIQYNNLIQREFDQLKNNRKLVPKTANLVGVLREFLVKYSVESDLMAQCEKLTGELDNAETVIAEIHMEWNTLHKNLLSNEIKQLISGLVTPQSELDVRARLTAITSLSLRNEALIECFINTGAVQTIVILCEKCEASSVRGLAMRALSTLCVNAAAIRKFESSAGLPLITEIIIDESRPEPERTEAVAVLAQITAPWIEDNHNIQNLRSYTKKLVKYLTRMVKQTRCCQNVLLCTAALANLTGMNQKSTKFLIQQNTVKILLEILKKHGVKTSVYLLEQVATLIANMSSDPEARVVLSQDCAAVALICFLQGNESGDEEVVKRLQQKSMIGLSRLCGETDSAKQVVEMGGVEKLVKLCREKKERFDNDAILVATLATLRKITEACGVEVVSVEDAQELIQPRLLDSFMAYSTQNESLV